ncbi:sigma-70 family RNA polymerase sigma factor [Singulisphaera sp. PoT]|uniref:sigma-70 family RNA polymerase sigma factor n=1 Tax=Singulisphaera sp. PoT TaxID=3411797 RepID=UPI003BF57331
MPKAPGEIVRVFAEGTLAGLSDGELLGRFAERGDGEAFASIVAKHGAMVLAACRATLGPRDVADADDAFQATFLVLARRAGSFPLHGSLSGWLYRVARRVARQARLEAGRRRAREQASSRTRTQGEAAPGDDPARNEIARIVRQELARLPERYRAPILLCDLHGLTRDQAAEALGCPPGTVAGRLARARIQLRERLIRRGVGPDFAWTSALAASPEDLLRLCRDACQAAASGVRGQVGSAAVALLAAKASRGLLASRLPAVLGLLLALGAVGTATAVFGSRSGQEERARGVLRDATPGRVEGGSPRADRNPEATVHEPRPGPRLPSASQSPGEPGKASATPAPQAPPALEDEPDAIDPEDPATAGVFAGRVVDAEGKAVERAKIYLQPASEPTRWQGPGEPGAVRAVTDAKGRFRFIAEDMTSIALDGLPARRRGLMVAVAEGRGADWSRTWGRSGPGNLWMWDPKKREDVTLTLSRGFVPIRGRLLGPDKRPVAGVTVVLTRFHVPWSKDLDAHLAAMKQSAGLAPSDYAKSLYNPGVLPGVKAETVTDADGRFRIDGLGPDCFATLEIRGPGVAETSIEVMTREGPEFRLARGLDPDHVLPGSDRIIFGAQFTLTLGKGRTVTGTVRDADSKAPLADVWVGPGLEGLDALESGRAPVATDARGRFSFDGNSADLINLHYAEMQGNGQYRTEHIVTAVPKPGQPYFLAKGIVNEAGEVVVECPRGIPFRLALRDEAGRPVEAEVTYSAIAPNPAFGKVVKYIQAQAGFPLSRAARQADGSYLGVALPGPGVVLARATGKTRYRPAFVDPKAFFAPGKTDWTPQEQISAYGSRDTLSVATFYGGGGVPQEDYAAIVLINPDAGSKSLELSATVVPDRPRQITVVDSDGHPVIGVQPIGLTAQPYDFERKFRAATFPITGLHPERPRRIIFTSEDRKLIGILMARGDSETPNTVRLQPWATLTGRILDEQGQPAPGASLSPDAAIERAAREDAGIGVLPGVTADNQGRFRVERLVPGQSYAATLYPGLNRPSGPAFKNLKLSPGETRDLGDLRLPAPAKP